MAKKNCGKSGVEFLVPKEDLEFLEKVSPVINEKKILIPVPTLSPGERMRRRLAWRNEKSLYHRECAGTGKKIISMYKGSSENEEIKRTKFSENNGSCGSDDSKIFKVYDNEFWWGDSWDARDYGRDFDFSRGFFEQFSELLLDVPKMARVQQGFNENSRFTNCASNNKNCYLTFSANENEDCLYSSNIDNSKDCLDCYWVDNCELAYQCIDCENSQRIKFSQKLHQCNDSYYSYDCIGCSNILACVGLRQKKYQILNKAVSKEEFEKVVEEIRVNPRKLAEVLEKLGDLFRKVPRKNLDLTNCENSLGDNLVNCKNSYQCFDSNNLEDCKYCDNLRFAKDCMDVSYYGCTESNELIYESEGSGHGVFHSAFCKLCWGGCQNLYYCYECFNCEDCFGCTGLKKARYCILNKQYSKEEYFDLMARIIKKMKETKKIKVNIANNENRISKITLDLPNGEWGEFFPIALSPFAYNETVAQDYFPIDSKIADKNGWKWLLENLKSSKYLGGEYKIPEKIEDVEDEICENILVCEKSKKNYKIQKSELNFYRKMKLPIPRFCPDVRHSNRVKTRKSRKLVDRKCDNCQTQITSVFARDCGFQVFCEKCYLEKIY